MPCFCAPNLVHGCAWLPHLVLFVSRALPFSGGMWHRRRANGFAFVDLTHSSGHGAVLLLGGNETAVSV
jgi:hypothetical protein